MTHLAEETDMSHNIYGPYAGRFISLEDCPLWDEEVSDEGVTPRTPSYYGQTRRLAEETGGTLIDLAGGCVGVVLRENPDGSIVIGALDDLCETLATWTEDAEGEQVGEPSVVEFGAFDDRSES